MAVWRPMTRVRLTTTSCVVLMFRNGGKPRLGGAQVPALQFVVRMRLAVPGTAHASRGGSRMRPPSQNGGSMSSRAPEA